MRHDYRRPQLTVLDVEAELGYAGSGVTASVADFDRQPWSTPAPVETEEPQ